MLINHNNSGIWIEENLQDRVFLENKCWQKTLFQEKWISHSFYPILTIFVSDFPYILQLWVLYSEWCTHILTIVQVWIESLIIGTTRKASTSNFSADNAMKTSRPPLLQLVFQLLGNRWGWAPVLCCHSCKVRVGEMGRPPVFSRYS